MILAFHGDAGIKASLIDLALAVEGRPSPGHALADAGAWPERGGIPAAIAALLIMLAERGAVTQDGAPVICGVLASIMPGTDLSHVPSQLAVAMLAAPELASVHGAAGDVLNAIIDLHARQAAGDAPDRAAWKAVRQQSLQLEGLPDRAGRAVATMCEAACWPADRGVSTLPAMARRWIDLAELEASPDWSPDDDARSTALLTSFWDAHARTRAAGQGVNYPALFYAAEPDLARRYEAHLARTNRRWAERPNELAAVIVDLANAAHARGRLAVGKHC